MSDLNCELTYVGKTLKACYGGSKVLVEYLLKTSSAAAKPNEYKVIAEVAGLEAGSEVWLSVYSIEAITNNENTLTDDAIEILLSDEFSW